MILSGILTLTMLYAALAPEAALRSTFGHGVGGPVADLVVRNWGALIGLIGAMLIYGARKPAGRPLALTVAGASKIIFIGLVLSYEERFLMAQAGVATAVDLRVGGRIRGVSTRASADAGRHPDGTQIAGIEVDKRWTRRCWPSWWPMSKSWASTSLNAGRLAPARPNCAP